MDYMSKQHCKHKRVSDTALWIGKMLGNLGKYMLGPLKQHFKSRAVHQEKNQKTTLINKMFLSNIVLKA